jgi:hypothetical protein
VAQSHTYNFYFLFFLKKKASKLKYIYGRHVLQFYWYYVLLVWKFITFEWKYNFRLFS